MTRLIHFYGSGFVFGLIVVFLWLLGGAIFVMAACATLAAGRWDATRQLRQEQRAQRRELFRDWGFALD